MKPSATPEPHSVLSLRRRRRSFFSGLLAPEARRSRQRWPGCRNIVKPVEINENTLWKYMRALEKCGPISVRTGSANILNGPSVKAPDIRNHTVVRHNFHGLFLLEKGSISSWSTGGSISTDFQKPSSRAAAKSECPSCPLAAGVLPPRFGGDEKGTKHPCGINSSKIARSYF